MAWFRARLARLQATTPLRAWARLDEARGGVLAGGIAYFAFFSLIPALTVGFTAFGYLLGGDTQLQQQVARRVNATIGVTLIGTRPGTGAVQLSDLVRQDVLTATGVFALAALAIAGLGWLQATREGIRAVFGLPILANPVLARLRDAAALLLLGLTVLGSVAAGVLVAAATGVVIHWLGWDGTPFAGSAVWLGGALVLVGVDALVFVVFLRVLAGVPVPLPDLRGGALLSAGGMQVLKLAAGLLAHRLSRNPLLASSIVLVGLLVWMNLAARLTLFGAAWTAVVAADRGRPGLPAPPGPVMPVHGGDAGQGTMGTATTRPPGRAAQGEGTMPADQRSPQSRAGRRPRPVDRSRPSPYARRGTPAAPTFGQRSADRVTLAAGVVLGAGALIGLRVARRALGAVRDVVRS